MNSLVEKIREKWEAVRGGLNERTRRRWAAAEVRSLGRGGLKLVQAATGLAFATIGRGLRELEEETADEHESQRVRRPGAGRPLATTKQPGLLDALRELVDPETRGDPESPLKWTGLGVRPLASELKKKGFQVSPGLVGRLLRDKLRYSLQGNRKTAEGGQHPDRNAQFRYINARVLEQFASSNPAISVDTKKKELVGNYKNGGTEWRPQGQPLEVKVHDFIGPLGRANPYGVFDIFANSGWMNVGVTADTAEFAVESIRRWWTAAGRLRYPTATELLITADGGGSNGYRVRLWKLELQRLADEIAIPITVCHLPPGTSKWNKIEHAFFSFVSINWRGKPLTDYATIIKLIAATTNQSGLTAEAVLDTNTYVKGRKVTPDEMDRVRLDGHAFHPEWNYTIHPTPLDQS